MYLKYYLRFFRICALSFCYTYHNKEMMFKLNHQDMRTFAIIIPTLYILVIFEFNKLVKI